MRRSIVRIILVSIGVVTSGCAQTLSLQAPLDGYVCSGSSFKQCLGSGAPAAADALHTVLYGPEFAPGTASPPDPNANQERHTAKGGYSCSYGAIQYQPRLSPDRWQSVVVVPTGLLLALGESMLQLGQLRTACDQAVADYDLQTSHLQKEQNDQDAESAAQARTQYLSAQVENVTLTKLNVPKLSAADCTKFDVSDPIVASAMLTARKQATDDAKALRADYQTASADAQNTDYPRRFEAVNAAIRGQLRTVSRYLLELDAAAVPLPAGTIYRLLVPQGSWVHQGTAIAEVK